MSRFKTRLPSFRTASAFLLAFAASVLFTIPGIGLTACGDELWSWGNNTYGQLGNAMTTSSSFPAQTGADGNWIAVSTRNAHTVALKADGTLWAWGDNEFGQLGDGTKNNARLSPVQVGTDSDWSAVSAGGQHTLAIKTDGTLWAWGRNTFGQLGDDTTRNRTKPVQIVAQQEIETDSGKETVTYATWAAVSAGAWHTMALTPDGKLWAWGHNYYAALGTGETANRFHSSPIRITAAINRGTEEEPNILTENTWTSVSAGFTHTAAIGSSGRLWTWGEGSFGQLGIGDFGTEEPIFFIIYPSPVPVGDDTNWAAITAGYLYTAALKTDGTLWAWGNNEYGQLGDGTTQNRFVPVQIGIDVDWEYLSAGRHTLATKTDGSLWTWGLNAFGQLGDGSLNSRSDPVEIGVGAEWTTPAAGFAYSTALTPGPENTAIQILGVNSTITLYLSLDTKFRVATAAAGPEGEPITYRFFYKRGYGTPEWATNTWTVVQDWSPLTEFETLFTEHDSYYIVAQAVTAGDTWEAGDPQGGFSLNTTADFQLTTITSNLVTNPRPGQSFRVTLFTVTPETEVTEDPPAETTILYRFYYRSGYGTPAWETNQWQMLQNWSTTNWVETSFETPGNYFIVGHAVTAGGIWREGDPQGGFNVVVE